MCVFRILATLLFIVALPTALLTSTIRFVANEGRVYRYAIDEFGATQRTGIARAELLRASAELRQFFNSDQETVNIKVQQNGREISLFNAKEIAHLEDVKSRFDLMNRAQELSVFYVLGFITALVLWAREFSARALALRTAASCLVALGLVAAAGALGAMGFSSAWEGFHELIFSNDFWLLDPRTDRLIQIFPEAFWQDIVFFIGLMAGAEAALLLIVATIYAGVSGSRRPVSRNIQTV